jgi:hypothetical protein
MQFNFIAPSPIYWKTLALNLSNLREKYFGSCNDKCNRRVHDMIQGNGVQFNIDSNFKNVTEMERKCLLLTFRRANIFLRVKRINRIE